MPKKRKKRKPQVPAPEEFAVRHAISLETASAIVSSARDVTAELAAKNGIDAREVIGDAASSAKSDDSKK